VLGLVDRHVLEHVAGVALVAASDDLRELVVAPLGLLLDEDGEVEGVLQAQLREVDLLGHVHSWARLWMRWILS